MARISRCSQDFEGIHFGSPRLASQIFSDDVILLASSGRYVKFHWHSSPPNVRISTSKSKTKVLSQKRVVPSLGQGRVLAPSGGV